jgi:hypothetical protein
VVKVEGSVYTQGQDDARRAIVEPALQAPTLGC